MTVSAYEAIKAKLLAGELTPGRAVSERALADELGVSRVPVREALLRLANDGLLVRGTGNTLVARTYDYQEIIDIYLYREALDGMVARLFTIRAEPMELSLLRAVLDRWEQVLTDYSLEAWTACDLNFHLTLARGAKNARLGNAFQTIHFECFYVLRNFRSADAAGAIGPEGRPAFLEDVLNEHRLILECAEKKDPDAAERAARESVRHATERWIRSYVPPLQQGGFHTPL